MENNLHQPEINILEDLEQQLVQASGGKRFLNFIIDSILSSLAYNFMEGFFTELLPQSDEPFEGLW